MHLIWAGREAKYFCKRGLTRFLKIRSDLPVGLICRSPMQRFDLPWRQISKQQDVPAAAVSIIVAIRLPCRRCSSARGKGTEAARLWSCAALSMHWNDA
jgi:hypothetical protein